MPAISLVVCIHRERDLLERLLRKADGCYDDLVVIHDGPENVHGSEPETPEPTQLPPIDYGEATGKSILRDGYHSPVAPALQQGISELVRAHNGRYFEGPRCYQQEPHWPFAWEQSRYDWILRLDADEFPSDELRGWLRKFRGAPEPAAGISGYTCIWPLWNGRKEMTRHWPAGRNFLFDRRRVRFFGMVEQVPIPDEHWEPLNLRLCHQPLRKSYGLANILVRKQGYHWRRVISQSLLKEPKNLPRWRWHDAAWPPIWRRIREQSVVVGIYFLLRDTGATLKAQWRAERRLMPLMALATPLHHFLINLELHHKRRLRQPVIAQR